MEKTKYDWQFYTEPSNISSLALKGGRVYWPRGKMLGGTGQINAMIYIRGNRRDYDNWEQMGNPGWDWDSVIKYFKKSEDNTDERFAMDSQFHATGGLLKVGPFGAKSGTKKLLKEAYKELGFSEILVSNENVVLGYCDAQGTVYGGERYGPAKAFLATAKGRKNLKVIKNAHVTKLRFDQDGAVNGVQFLSGDMEMGATAKKEVVVSAGVIGSPQILMLSGIGPSAELKQHNITIRKDLPVGLNLQDHIVIPIAMVLKNSTAFTPTDTADHMYEYLLHRKGYFTNLGGGDLMLFASTVNDPEFPDIQINPMNFERKHPDIEYLLNMFNINDETIKSFTKQNDKARVMMWGVCILNPKSRGRISLTSKSPLDAPKINPNYLHDQADRDLLVNGIKMMTRLTQTKTFVEQGGQWIQAKLPACDLFEFQSDQYWQCYVSQMTITGYHHGGSCKMGPLSEEETVVDSELKVKGVKGLRVVDASIMPKLVSGNTNAPTIMISEMGADFIKSDWLESEQIDFGNSEIVMDTD